MKVVYYFPTFRSERELAVVQSIYGSETEYVNKKEWNDTQKFEMGDFFVCGSIYDLLDTAVSHNEIDQIVREYMTIYRQGAELLFDKSTQCNSLFIKTLITNDYDFESVLRKCIANYASQMEIASRYAKQHMFTAAVRGSHVGIRKGSRLTTQKSVRSKEQIRKLSKDFDGVMSDEELIKELNISRNSFYKYKRELREEIE